MHALAPSQQLVACRPRSRGASSAPRAAAAARPLLARQNIASVAALRPSARSVRGRALVAGAAFAELHDQDEEGVIDLPSNFSFFKVEAIVRPWRCDYVVAALDKGGIRGVTVYDVRGSGVQGGAKERYHGSEFTRGTLVEKVKLEVVVNAMQVNDVVNMIVEAAQTGEIGDGKIFIIPVADIIRIRTQEHGKAAERMAGGREDMTKGLVQP